MVKDSSLRKTHRCECRSCREHPRGGVAAEHRAINRLLALSNERMRRLLVGFLAEQLGRGGTSLLAQITGLDRKTIASGRRELRPQGVLSTASAPLFHGRVRRPGAGRKSAETVRPEY